MNTEQKILLIKCSDSKGLIAKITNICFQYDLNITRNDEFVDRKNNLFFMRTELEGIFNETKLLTEVTSTLPADAQIRLVSRDKKPIIIMATREVHCLGELIMKSKYGSLNADIVAIISNHPDLEPLAKSFNIPFHYLSHNSISREEHEEKIREVIDSYQAKYLVLAKYMRILNPEFIASYPEKIINIHHSFLPAFIGAKPYHQAYERGVKIIGATAHFVTNDLDEGPIIYQDVVHVNHRYSAKDMAQAGQQIEESVLNQALQLVLEEKVFIHGNRTIVFE